MTPGRAGVRDEGRTVGGPPLLKIPRPPRERMRPDARNGEMGTLFS
jgi:hypothetical protein